MPERGFMKIALASDHAGFKLKEQIKAYLKQKEFEIKDFGTYSEESMDYPDTVKLAARAVANGEYERGILVCGSGVGAMLVANKIKGIRATLCPDEYTADYSRKHNDTNMVSFSGRKQSINEVSHLLDIWLSTEYEGGRHQNRLDKISRIEEEESLQIDALTKVYCIIGNPVKHSFSPAMHNAAFKKEGINAVYVAFEVTELEMAVRGIKALGICGASVTIPHKINIIPCLDEVSEIARMIGSVNTLVNKEGKIFGTNTDAEGFYKALSLKTEVNNKNIALFGAGGAGRAILFALFYYAKPAKVFLLDTDKEKQKSLKENIDREFLSGKHKTEIKLETIEKDAWSKIKDKVDIIINATPIGMEPDYNFSILTLEEIPHGCTVMDIVYHPHKTRLLQYAEERKCRIVYGIDMLLYQGVLQFELWTGRKAPIEVMRRALEEKVYSSHAL